ncbi:MAG: iron-sulfur cluster assembly accessory protein [Hydrogenibacillus sp.]|nr:iron-sulfur cluster assembly accessory protein [Hydrogenibacillus sp.]
MVVLTERAGTKIRELFQEADVAEGYLRIGVQPSCCSGFSYGLMLDTERHDGDQEFLVSGVKVLVNAEETRYVDGVEIDYIDDGVQQGFTVVNTKLAPSCGCGSSYQLPDEALPESV